MDGMIRHVSAVDSLDLPTASALVRLRLLAEDARRRADDTSAAGGHLALVALDGACEYALWLASRERGVPVKERAGVPELYSAVKRALEDWQVRGWRGVSQMHQARNVAQHAGIALDAAQLPNWADATIAFIDSLCVAAFGTRVEEIVLADAVRDQSLRTQLRWSEEQLLEDPGRSFLFAVRAFDEARRRWRTQRSAPVFAPSPGGSPSFPDSTPPPHEVDEFLEVQPFAGDFGEYIWLRRAREELEQTGWPPDAQEARRALVFVSAWIVRWEIFDKGYPADRWEAHREGIEPPVSGDGTTPSIIGTQVELLPPVPGRPARNIVYLALANVPNRGRAPWGIALRNALAECARDVGPGLFSEIHWSLSGMLVVHVALNADPQVVADVVERAVALAAERHATQLADSRDRERERRLLEKTLRAILASARSDDLGLFGEVSVVDDEWLGTFGWLAFLQVRTGERGQEELTQTHGIFGNQRAVFPNLHFRGDRIAFSVSEITPEFEEALRTAIADSEEQARHVRGARARQAQAFQDFASGFEHRFGPLPDA
jgi:hypothetical protein